VGILIVILAILLVRTIFLGGCCAIYEIDPEVQSQINGQFSNNSVKFVVYPLSKEVKIEQGKSEGVAFAIKNTESTQGVFEYSVHASKLDDKCLERFSLEKANNLIVSGGTTRNIVLNAGKKMDEAVLIKFEIQENTPLCDIEYKVDVKKDNAIYGQTDFKLKIVS